MRYLILLGVVLMMVGCCTYEKIQQVEVSYYRDKGICKNICNPKNVSGKDYCESCIVASMNHMEMPMEMLNILALSEPKNN